MAKTSASTLLTLPSELIEATLICSCSPRSVASIAQTCQTLRTLVYASPDSHLWRELFLTTWDDPRPALEHRALVDPRVNPATWDWGTEYRRRVRADKWLKAWRRDILPADVDPRRDPAWYAETMSTLLAVLDTLMTLRPFPAFPPIALTLLTPAVSQFPMESTRLGVGERRERMASAPPLPPLLVVLASGLFAVTPSQSGVRLGRMVYGPHASSALLDGEGTSTRTPIPTPSLPPHLIRTLLASHTVGVRGIPPYAPHLWDADFWARDPLGDVFHRIICITGFVPIPPPISTSTFIFTPGSVSERTLSTSLDANGQNAENKVTQDDGRDHVEKARVESEGQRMGYITEPFRSPSEQHADARILARRRVYDMQYLRGDRVWGPFHLVSKESLDYGASPLGTDCKHQLQKDETHATPRRSGSRHLNTLAWAMGMDVELDDLDATSDDNSGDEDWRDPTETSLEASSSSQRRNPEREQVAGGEYMEDSGSDTETEAEHILSLILTSPHIDDSEPTTNSNSSRRRTRRSNARRSNSVDPRDIKPEHLKPDYTYLASARIVVETNLKELLGCVIGDDDDVLASTSDTRAGGVGMFWEDEDEILQGQSDQGVLSTVFLLAIEMVLTPLGTASYLSRALVSPTTTPAGNSTATTTTTFELEDLLSQFRNLEVARLGGASGYWSPWVTRQRSEKASIHGGAGASVPSSNGDMGLRKPRIVTQRTELEKPREETSTTRGKGKGKEKRADTLGPGAGAELGDWEIGPEGEACEGWDWAGVSGIWR